jgi:hypothetical protein
MESARKEGNLSTRVQHKRYTKLQSPAGPLSFPLALACGEERERIPRYLNLPPLGKQGSRHRCCLSRG